MNTNKSLQMNKQGVDALENYFQQWRKISGRLEDRFLSPIQELQKAFEKSRPTQELQKAIESSLGPLEPFFEAQRRIQKVLEEINLPSHQLQDLTLYANYTKQIEKHQKALSGIISPTFKELQHIFRKLSLPTQEALLLLAQHGWYFDFNMPYTDLWEIAEGISNGEIDEVENALAEYFESQIKEIEKSITTLLPHRAHIIRPAIKAHLRGDYYLSIPVLLVQTDGICKDVVGQHLFMKKDGKPKIAIYVEKQVAADTFKAALLSPLAASTPITASEYERGKDFNLLNRHMVLHGESLDYGNKGNSLKAVSLINYISQALKRDADTT